jgi:hypothetical protein
MRRLHLGLFGSLLSVALLGLVLAGCSDKGKKADTDEDDTAAPTAKSGKSKSSGAELKPVEAKGSGTLKGKITVKGGDVASIADRLTGKLREDISKNTDKARCMAGSDKETTQQAYRVGDNKQLGNVAIFLKAPKGYFFKIDEKQIEEAKKNPVTIDQPHCAFMPHVSTLFPQFHDPKKPKNLEPTGQILIVKNDAEMGHNTLYPSGNVTLTPGTQKEVNTLEPSYLNPAEFKCNIHGWMNAHVWVLDHPYAAVSLSDTSPHAVKKDDASFGTYEIKNVPTGVKVRLIAWHEKLGFLNGNDGEEIELKDGTTTKDFEVEIKE